MSRTSRQKQKFENGDEVFRDNNNEGTAARTRPFSYEEILLKRKINKLKGDAKDGVEDPGKTSRKDKSEKLQNRSESDERYEDVMKHVTEDTVKVSLSKKQERTTTKEGLSRTSTKEGLGKIKGKESYDTESIVKQRLEKDFHMRAKEEMKDKGNHQRIRNEERSKDDAEGGKHRDASSVGKGTYVDTERRKSEREGKRKHQNKDDDKDRLRTEGKSVKKHDSGRHYDLEPSERKSRKTDSSHYEDPRAKRRRSRSRETRDRDRRPSSLSPKAHKRSPSPRAHRRSPSPKAHKSSPSPRAHKRSPSPRTHKRSLSPRAHKRSYHGREHGESSHHSFNDKKQFSDVDRGRTSNNVGYANSHYQRHGGRGSRLGGYSPRKRRTEAAVKTPSPTARSPERKNAGWDLPPVGTNASTAGSLPNSQATHQIISSSVLELLSSIPASTNADGAHSSIPSMSKNVSVESIHLTQATRPMRRLYVENVPTSASDKAVVDCFNDFFLSLGDYHIEGIPPCISCTLNKERGQASVEFLTPEDATTALSFDGRSISGSILKIRRPKDFIESSTGALEKHVPATAAISDVIKDSPYKIFIGGISRVLSSDMIMEIASAFGTLRAYRFTATEDTNEPCAFMEYVDHSTTEKACAGLNGMKLGGQVLTVVQATPDASIEENTEMPPFYGIPSHAKPLLSRPTTVLKLKNVLNQEEFSTLSGPELEEVIEDARLECARFGTIKSFNIVKYITSSATIPEVVNDQADVNIVKSDSQPIEDESNTSKTIPTEAAHDEPLVDGEGAEEKTPSNDENLDDLKIPSQLNSIIPLDGPSTHPDPDAIPQESPKQLEDKSTDQSALPYDTNTNVLLTDDSKAQNSLMAAEELKPEDANGDLQETSIEKNDTASSNLDTTTLSENRQQGNDLEDVFEQGCIFVEYMRSEASCMAAHCLHGRLYGDRIVVVDYIDHDLYLKRFPK